VVLHYELGKLLEQQQPPRWGQAVECYAAAWALRPDLGEALANALVNGGSEDEGFALYERLVAERKDNPYLHFLHFQRGYAFDQKGRYKEGEAAYREAIRLKPDFPLAHVNLGVALGSQGRHKEAEAACREAIRLKPDFPEAHSNLGIVLNDQGRHKEAEAAYHEALRLKPDLPEAHFNLGVALNDQGRPEEAEAAWREAIRLKPDFPEAHYNLGYVLNGQGRYKEAEAAYRDALRLKPDDPAAHINLGNALLGQERYKEAEAACREALRLKPEYPKAHVSLGNALGSQGRHKEVEAACREALRLKPDFPEAHSNLGIALSIQGRFVEALESLRRAHAMGSQTPGWPHPSADWVRDCERLIELDRKLPTVLGGDAEPSSAAERLALGRLCQKYKQRHVAAARFYADAFAADPKLASDLSRQPRYYAACSAALAAAGQGEDAKHLPDKVTLMLRGQALHWLQADLALYTKMADREEATVKQAVRQRLAHWQQDTDLASVRDKEALDKLPEQERRQWRKLWEDVAALLQKVEPQK
jgi:tetratricopeptide (TPR) repeat protein